MRTRGFGIALVLLALGTARSYAQDQWNTQFVDNSGDVGYNSSVAYDSKGNPHIAYTNSPSSTGTIYYAYGDSAGWHAEVVGSGNWPSLALDSAGRPRIIAYYYLGALRYHTRIGTTWTYEQVTASATNAAGLRIPFVLVDDDPCIAYWANGGNELRFAYKIGSNSWTISTIDTGTNLGQYASMAIDVLQRVYISYYDGGGGDLRLAYRDLGSVWHTFVVDGAVVPTDVGQYSSLVLDNSLVPHVCYYDATHRQLKHVTITNLP